jgi:hypothetical protein
LTDDVHSDDNFLALARIGDDDLAVGMNPDLIMGPGPTSTVDRPSRAVSSLLTYSSTARFVEKRLAGWAAKRAIIPGEPRTDLFAGSRADESDLKELHAPSLRHVRALADLSAWLGIPFVVIHLPLPHQISPDEWTAGCSAYGFSNKTYPAFDIDLIQKYCGENGILHAPLLKGLRSFKPEKV